jgi:hypothetical protein
MSAQPKLLKIPDKVHTLDEMLGMIRQVEDLQNIVVILEDSDGVTTMTIDGTTAERMNWMLDRANLLLHRED